MDVFSLLKPIEIRDVPQNYFVVVHPLDDVCETKWRYRVSDRCP
jgi:hypothetical protein